MMSALDRYKEAFILQVPTEVPDGLGGTITTYEDSTEFMLAFSNKSSSENRWQDKPNVASEFRCRMDITEPIKFGDILRRVRDNSLFRVTNYPDDNITPRHAVNAYKWCTLERWEL